MMMVLWLVLLIGGNLLLVAGLFLTRQTWRPDVEPFHRGSPIIEIMFHPDRFATPERLRPIRVLNFLGGFLLGAAVCVLVFALFATR